MSEITANQNDLILGLRLFAGLDVRVESVIAGPGFHLYRVVSPGLTVGVKVFDSGDEESRTPDARAAAEAAGLAGFSRLGIAPELLWQGTLDRGGGEPVVAYRWPSGVPGSACEPASEAAVSLARALRTVHSASPDVKLISPHPRNLERWWEKTHQRYRELPGGLMMSLPSSVHNTLARLVNAVAADAQAHKRFWTGAHLTPVHGAATVDNLWIDRDNAVLVDWQRFGLGDPSYDVAVAACLIALQLGGDAADGFLGAYLEGESDEMLARSRRITLYRRLWPFEYVLRMLDAVWVQAQAEQSAWGVQPRPLVHAAAILSYVIELCMRTYEWHPTELEETNRDLQEWIADLELAMEKRVARQDL